MKRTLLAALSELVGTFFLAWAAMSVAAPFTAFAVGLVLLVFVYAIGGISGCHLNPGVTVGLVAARAFPLAEGVLYIGAQVVGAWLARLALASGAVGGLGAYHSGSGIAEFLGIGILMLAVSAVTEKRVTSAGSGVAVGPALAAGLLVSGGVLNPAIALAMGLGSTPALWSPLLGGAAFALLFTVLKQGTPPKEA